MIACAIVEDNELNLELLQGLLDHYISQTDTNFNITVFKDAEEMIRNFYRYDIYLLDIVLPGINGIKLGNIIREMDKHGKIAYVSGEKEYAIEACSIGVSGFLVKPLIKEELFNLLDKIRKEIKEENSIVDTIMGERKIKTNLIKYINIEGRNLIYHLNTGEIIESICLRTAFRKAVPNLIEHEDFIFVEPSLLLRIDQIMTLDKDHLYFHDGELLYFPKTKYNQIREKWRQYDKR